MQVDESTQVPKEHVKNKEIVLNVSFDATSGLKLGNEYIEFKGRFSGIARDIIVPDNRVIAIFARENSQGMAFPNPLDTDAVSITHTSEIASPATTGGLAEVSHKPGKLVSVENVSPASQNIGDEPDDPRPNLPSGTRPTLKRVK